MSSVVSLWALNPLLLPAVLLAWLLTMSAWLTRYPIVRTVLYLMAVAWSQAVIAGIRCVAPISFLYVAYTMLGQYVLPSFSSAIILPALPYSSGLAGLVTFLYCFTEVCFYFSQLHRCSQLQQRIAGPLLSTSRRWLTFRRVEASSHCVASMKMPRECTYYTRFEALRPEFIRKLQERKERREKRKDQRRGSKALNNVDHEDDVINTPSPSPDADQLVQSYGSNELDDDQNPLSVHSDGPHPLEFLRGWFFNIPLRHIKHDNLLVFFAESK